MTKETGGHAFPYHDGFSNRQTPGMSLRDYFAAQALQGLLADHVQRIVHCGELPIDFKTAAKLAYEYADAMLAAREGE